MHRYVYSYGLSFIHLFSYGLSNIGKHERFNTATLRFSTTSHVNRLCKEKKERKEDKNTNFSKFLSVVDQWRKRFFFQENSIRFPMKIINRKGLKLCKYTIQNDKVSSIETVYRTTSPYLIHINIVECHRALSFDRPESQIIQIHHIVYFIQELLYSI